MLEPEEPLRAARRAFYAGMVALRDALMAHAPPERPITFAWPDAIHVDGGLIGGGRLAGPPGAAETEPPDWLVFGATVRIVAMGEGEAGLRPLATALGEEGFDDVGSDQLVESFARHLMVAMDAWQRERIRHGDTNTISTTCAREGRHPLASTTTAICSSRWRGQKEPDRHALAAALASPVLARSCNRRAAHVKLLRTIRLDPSDTFVFERAARARRMGGARGVRLRRRRCCHALAGKARAAFRSGFLGIDSLGWSTLVQVVEASEEDRAAAVDLLAQRLVEHFGAPDLATARPRGRGGDRVCRLPLRSSQGDAGGRGAQIRGRGIREAFRTLTPEHRTETHPRLRVPRGRGRRGCTGRAGRPADARQGDRT